MTLPAELVLIVPRKATEIYSELVVVPAGVICVAVTDDDAVLLMVVAPAFGAPDDVVTSATYAILVTGFSGVNKMLTLCATDGIAVLLIKYRPSIK